MKYWKILINGWFKCIDENTDWIWLNMIFLVNSIFYDPLFGVLVDCSVEILEYIRDTLGVSPKILAECIVLSDPNNWCFIAFLRKNFRLCCSMGPNFSRKNLSKIRYIFGFFFQTENFFFDTLTEIFSKNQCFTLQNGFKWKDFVEFWWNRL